MVTVGGFPFCCLSALPFAYFPAPSPRPRSQSDLPRWGRGSLRLFPARGFAPCIPAAEPERHWFDFKKPIQFGVAGERRLQSIKIREKFLGGWGLLSRSPQALPRPLHPPGLNPGDTGSTLRNRFFGCRRRTPVAVNKNFEKSSWGFGGFFQEAPKRFPAPCIPGG